MTLSRKTRSRKTRSRKTRSRKTRSRKTRSRKKSVADLARHHGVDPSAPSIPFQSFPFPKKPRSMRQHHT
jgi:hypothetical protein